MSWASRPDHEIAAAVAAALRATKYWAPGPRSRDTRAGDTFRDRGCRSRELSPDAVDPRAPRNGDHCAAAHAWTSASTVNHRARNRGVGSPSWTPGATPLVG